MTITTRPRTGTNAWSADTDAWPARAGWNTQLGALESAAAIYGQGVASARPVSALVGRFFYTTDTQRLFYDTGTAWVEVSPVGGGGAPAGIDIGDAGAEGASRIAARADHQHAMPVPSTDPAAVTYGGVAARGSSTTSARSDHTHALAGIPFAGATPPAVTVGGSGVVGVATTLARADHGHGLGAPDANPGAQVFGAVADRGVSTTPARADHTHAGDPLPIATAANPVTGIDIGDATTIGSQPYLARSDHQHALPVPNLDPRANIYGQTGTRGSSTTVARADHGHTLPTMVDSATALNINGSAADVSNTGLFRFKTGQYVILTNGNGDITLATGCATVCVWAGYWSIDDTASGAVHLSQLSEYTSVGSLALRCRRVSDGTPLANVQVRITCITLGY